VASEGKPINVVDRFVIWESGIGEQHKQSTEQNTKTKNTNLTSNKLNHDGHKLNKVTKTKFAALRVIGQRKI
jgi:hypothetical protein